MALLYRVSIAFGNTKNHRDWLIAGDGWSAWVTLVRRNKNSISTKVLQRINFPPFLKGENVLLTNIQASKNHACFASADMRVILPKKRMGK